MPFIRSKSVVCSLWKEDDLSFPEDSSFESGGISARRAYGRKKCVNVVIHLPRWTLGLVIQKTRLITPLLSRVVTRSTSRVDSSTLRSPTPRNFVCETKFWQIWSISEGKCQNVRFSRFYKKENKNPVLFKVFFLSQGTGDEWGGRAAQCGRHHLPGRYRPSAGDIALLAPAIPDSRLISLSWSLSLLQALDGRLISKEHILPLQGFSGQN